MDHRSADSLFVIWRLSLAFFFVAAVTGTAYRFGLITGETFGLSLVNIRHAHSHLMYFGWVTPALMVLMALRMPAGRESNRRAVPVWIFAGIFLASAAIYPPFLLYGYGRAPIGDDGLPLSVMLSGLHILFWYAFVWSFLRRSDDVRPDAARVLWMGAVFFLVTATIGAWGLPLLPLFGEPSAALSTALTHVFLDHFSEGWLVLGILGLAYHDLQTEESWPRWSVWLIFAGLPLSFALTMPEIMVPGGFRFAARISVLLLSVGLLANVRHLWIQSVRSKSPAWRLRLFCLL